MKHGLTYKDAGVNIDAGEKSVKDIAKLVKGTFNQHVIRDVGLFGAFFRPDFSELKDPVLVSSVDGVGTKLKIAFMADSHHTVGEDLVNHCVNDIMTSGAIPLFFLDYIAFTKLSGDIVTKIVDGMARGCKNACCALIGGETAEMPDFYPDGEYDISGTIVGVVDGHRIVDGSRIKKGDVLVALPSNGLHTNGYSLVRKIFFSLHNYQPDDYIDSLGCTLGEELLKVHRCYYREIMILKDQPFLHGMSHITGGGIEGNTKRILPTGVSLKIDWSSWKPPAIFSLIQDTGQVAAEEMRHVFNLGVGYIFIVDRKFVDNTMEKLNKNDQKPFIIGEVK